MTRRRRAVGTLLPVLAAAWPALAPAMSGGIARPVEYDCQGIHAHAAARLYLDTGGGLATWMQHTVRARVGDNDVRWELPTPTQDAPAGVSHFIFHRASGNLEIRRDGQGDAVFACQRVDSPTPR